MSNGPIDQHPDQGDLTRLKIHQRNVEEHLDKINQEFRRGFEFLQKYPKSVSIFGSSLAPQDSDWCRHANELAARISKELGYAVVTGGGPGIMEAAARGTSEAGGKSVGIRINLLREQTANHYVNDALDFTYFFSRKTMLAFAAETYVFFPGGYGTLDELFGILTLIQTSKIPRVPIILFESSFWTPYVDLIKKTMLGEPRTIDAMDLELFEVSDSYDRVLEVVRKAPVSEWWKNID